MYLSRNRKTGQLKRWLQTQQRAHHAPSPDAKPHQQSGSRAYSFRNCASATYERPHGLVFVKTEFVRRSKKCLIELPQWGFSDPLLQQLDYGSSLALSIVPSPRKFTSRQSHQAARCAVSYRKDAIAVQKHAIHTGRFHPP